MQREVSWISILGVVLIALAAVLGISIGIFAITKDETNEGTSAVSDTLANVSDSYFKDFDNKIVNATTVIAMLNNLKNSDYAVFINTRSMNSGGLLSQERKLLYHADSVYINIGKYFDYSDDGYLTASEINMDLPNSTLLEARNSSSLKTIKGFSSEYSDATGAFETVGMVENISSNTKFQCNLIYDSADTIIGIIAKQINNATTSGLSGTGDGLAGTNVSPSSGIGGASGVLGTANNIGLVTKPVKDTVSNSNVTSTPDRSTKVIDNSLGDNAVANDIVSGVVVPDNTTIVSSADTTQGNKSGYSLVVSGGTEEEKQSTVYALNSGTYTTEIDNSLGNVYDSKFGYATDEELSEDPTAFRWVFEDSACTKLIGWKGTLPSEISVPEGTEVLVDYLFTASIDDITSNGCGGDSSYTSKTLTNVIFPSTLLSIGTYTFSCTALREVIIPDNVKSIGADAFWWCSSLKSVEIGNGISSINARTFEDCSNLVNVSIPSSVKSIGNEAFAFCSALSSIEIPDSVTSIGQAAFYYCDALTDVKISNNVTSINPETFAYCSSLTSINIPDSVKNIYLSAFAFCSKLSSVDMGNSVISIGSSAFYNCTALTSIDIPDSVTSIGNYAFYNIPLVHYAGTASGSPWGALKVHNYNSVEDCAVCNLPYTVTITQAADIGANYEKLTCLYGFHTSYETLADVLIYCPTVSVKNKGTGQTYVINADYSDASCYYGTYIGDYIMLRVTGNLDTGRYTYTTTLSKTKSETVTIDDNKNIDMTICIGKINLLYDMTPCDNITTVDSVTAYSGLIEF